MIPWLNSKYLLKLLFCLFVFLVSGCVTYKPAENVHALHERISQKTGDDLIVRHDEFEAQCIPIVNENVAKANLGIHPAYLEMLPVFLKVDNAGQNPIKVDLPNSFITVGERQTIYLDTDSVVERIAKRDEDAAFAFGMMFGVLGGVSGAVVGVTVGTAVDSSKVGSGMVKGHYYSQSFNPVFVHPNHSGGGLVFYHLLKEDIECEKLTLTIPIVDLNKNKVLNAEFIFKPADYTKIKEDKK